jgi:translation initiation factor IF-1
MSDDKIEMSGTVLREHRGDLFEVECAAGSLRRTVLAKRSGRLVKFRIRLLPGDHVTVEVSPYDPTRGRITYRGAQSDAARRGSSSTSDTGVPPRRGQG